MSTVSASKRLRDLAISILECEQALLAEPDDQSPLDSLEDFAVELAKMIVSATS